MSRWKVFRYPTVFGYSWAVGEVGKTGIKLFATWREAMDYADRMARTREYVLPRPQLNQAGYVEFDFTEWSGLDYTPEWPDGATYDRRTGPNKPPFGASVWIPREHWKPLALVLLALAEQENA